MQLRKVTIVAALALAGCHQSNSQQDASSQPTASPLATERPLSGDEPTEISTDASSLLKVGDPHVCANDQVESILFDIMKNNSAYVKSYKDPYRQYVLDNLIISASTITSSNVNIQSQTISCGANVHMSANDISQEFDADAQINYDVSQDLSSDGQIVVKADMSGAEQPLKILGAQILNKKYPG